MRISRGSRCSLRIELDRLVQCADLATARASARGWIPCVWPGRVPGPGLTGKSGPDRVTHHAGKRQHRVNGDRGIEICGINPPGNDLGMIWE
jgi:hypothetical protein